MVQAVTGMVHPRRQGLQIMEGPARFLECPSFCKVSEIFVKQSHCYRTNSKTKLISISMDVSIVITD
jgi:hypothetical protein